jgi:hypothetical protein
VGVAKEKMLKVHFTTLILACVWLQTSSATTVVYVVTPSGIVVGIDGKVNHPDGTAVKMFLLNHRVALADIYAERATKKDGTATLYDFPVWVKSIKRKIASATTVEEMSRIVADDTTRTFSFAIEAINSGIMTQNNSGLDNVLVQYIMAGYDSGGPTIYSVGIDIDWKRKSTTAPNRVLVQPEKGQRVDSRIGAFGQHVAISQIGDAQSDAHRKAVAKLPLEYQVMDAGKDLTLEQASNVVRASLGIEAEANPKFVGFPIVVVTIPKTGRGRVRTYKRDVPAFSRIPDGK